MKKDKKLNTEKKEKALQFSFWSSKQNHTTSSETIEYKQITKYMPFTLKIAK